MKTQILKSAFLFVGVVRCTQSAYELGNDALHNSTYWLASRFGYVSAPVIAPANLKALVTESAVKEGISPVWAMAVAKVESNEGNHNLSPKGARGYMQIMVDTGKRFCNLTKDELDDPTKNIPCGVHILAEELKTNHHDMISASAAYNCGDGKLSHLPRETVEYVHLVTNAIATDTLS